MLTSELPAHTAPPRFRLAVAVGLGTLSIAGSLLLVVTDGVNASVHWTHHAGLSAAPLLLVAGAIAAMSIAHPPAWPRLLLRLVDRKSTRLNSSHLGISYAVFCLKKK